MGSPGYYNLAFRNPVVIPPYSHKVFRVFLRGDPVGGTFSCFEPSSITNLSCLRGSLSIDEASLITMGFERQFLAATTRASKERLTANVNV